MLSLDRRQAEAAAPPVITPPGINYTTYMAIQWSAASFAIAFVVIRLISRWRGPHRIFWDDVFAVFAAILVLVTAALWQWAAKDMYYILDLQAGLVPLEPDYAVRMKRELMVTLISEIFFYVTLFAIKISFILFFKRLGSKVRGQKWYRWIAFGLSAVCFIVSVGDMGFHCLINDDLVYLSTYCVSPKFNDLMANAVTINCVLDVVSDLAITIIPFTLLWDVRIHLRKKLAFTGLFSLTLITIAAAVARAVQTALTKKAMGLPDVSYVWTWGTIQAGLAVVVSCLSSFPQLFAASGRKAKPQWTPTETYYQRLRSRMQKRSAKSTDPLYDMSAVTFNDRDEPNHKHTSSQDSERPVLSPVTGRTKAHCSTFEDPHPAQQNQITRQVEYQIEVADNPATTQQWPLHR